MAVATLSGAGFFGKAVSFTEGLVPRTIGPALVVFVFNGLMDHVGPFVVSLFVGTVSSSVVDVINSTVQEVE